MTSSKGKLDAVYPALMAILKNIGAQVERLSSTTCSKILQLFASMSAPSFLLANETNNYLLSALLEFINVVIEHQFSSESQVFFISVAEDGLTAGRKPLPYLRHIENQEEVRSFALVYPREWTARDRTSNPTSQSSLGK